MLTLERLFNEKCLQIIGKKLLNWLHFTANYKKKTAIYSKIIECNFNLNEIKKIILLGKKEHHKKENKVNIKRKNVCDKIKKVKLSKLKYDDKYYEHENSEADSIFNFYSCEPIVHKIGDDEIWFYNNEDEEMEGKGFSELEFRLDEESESQEFAELQLKKNKNIEKMRACNLSGEGNYNLQNFMFNVKDKSNTTVNPLCSYDETSNSHEERSEIYNQKHDNNNNKIIDIVNASVSFEQEEQSFTSDENFTLYVSESSMESEL